MEKVKVTKEVFNALEELKRTNGDLRKDITNYAKKYIEDKWRMEKFKPLNSIDLDKFVDCAYYGYEVETTLEEYIDILLNVHSGSDDYDKGFRDALILIREKLGIDLDSLK